MKNFFLNSPLCGRRMADDGTHPPGLRRATCSQGETGRMRFWDPRDDTGNREVWEENHFLIGKDVVYNQMLDPQFIAPEREANIGDFVKEGKWLARNLNPYRADGGGGGVILSRWASKTKDSLLGTHFFPNPRDYYLKCRFTWIEKVTKMSFRKEQVDHDKRLIKNGFTMNPEFFARDFVTGGNMRTQDQMHDYRMRFRS